MPNVHYEPSPPLSPIVVIRRRQSMRWSKEPRCRQARSMSGFPARKTRWGQHWTQAERSWSPRWRQRPGGSLIGRTASARGSGRCSASSHSDPPSPSCWRWRYMQRDRKPLNVVPRRLGRWRSFWLAAIASPPTTPPIAVEVIAGSLSTLAYRQIRDIGPHSLPALAPICTYIALAPFVGAEEACVVVNREG